MYIYIEQDLDDNLFERVEIDPTKGYSSFA